MAATFFGIFLSFELGARVNEGFAHLHGVLERSSLTKYLSYNLISHARRIHYVGTWDYMALTLASLITERALISTKRLTRE